MHHLGQAEGRPLTVRAAAGVGVGVAVWVRVRVREQSLHRSILAVRASCPVYVYV